MSVREDFIEGVWEIIPGENPDWVDRVESQKSDHSPLGDYPAIIRFMKSKGVPSETIARFARIVGYETAFGILCFLDDPGYVNQEVDFDYLWRLQVFDAETDEVVSSLGGLYESLLSGDPSGREMRPREA